VLRAAQEAAEACHLELSSLAADSALLPTRDRGASRGWHLALNAAYLVPDADTEAFHARVDALARQYRPQGLRIDLTGPWPPYNFAALDLSETAT
jgi:gas vesicle protein GvpL/GvpF